MNFMGLPKIVPSHGTPNNCCDGCGDMFADPERDEILCPSCRFRLTNTPPKPAKVPLGNVGNGGVQKALFTGLDCLPDQMDLFNTDATNGETR